jgi:hypothetical protein
MELPKGNVEIVAAFMAVLMGVVLLVRSGSKGSASTWSRRRCP